MALLFTVPAIDNMEIIAVVFMKSFHSHRCVGVCGMQADRYSTRILLPTFL